MTHNLQTYCCTFHFAVCECILKRNETILSRWRSFVRRTVEVEKKQRKNFSICFECSEENVLLHKSLFFSSSCGTKSWNLSRMHFFENNFFIHSMKYCIKWPSSENCSFLIKNRFLRRNFHSTTRIFMMSLNAFVECLKL